MIKRRMASFFYKTPQAGEATSPKMRNGVVGILGRALKKLCLALGALMLFSIIMGLIAGSIIGGGKKSLPSDMILVLNITDPIGESEHARSITDPLAAAGITIGDVIQSIDRARDDKRVKGLLVSLDNAGMELTHIQELRTAVKWFQTSGKFAYIYTGSFADLGSGIGAYYLASAFEQIWMQPVGMVAMTGLSLEIPFAKDALDKVGAQAQFLHREEYKSAMESFTNSHMSEPNRESMQSILDDFSKQVFDDISADRKIPAAMLKVQLDKGLITGTDALEAGLITNLDYADVLLKKVREKVTGKKDSKEPPLVALEDYYTATAPDETKHTPDTVALVNIAGEIVAGDDPEPGYATGDYIADAIRDAADDSTVKIIVMRVDSPGGSPTASETIRRSIVYAKEKGKKIIVSMGPVAASGGYWIVVDADRIFAMPSTLTGSIGVIMGKFEISGLWNKVGVNWDSLSWGRNARMWSMNEPMSESAKESLNVAIDNTYTSFINRVAEGRKMKIDDVRAIAKGRAWTGLQAKANGLVDEIGGLDSAMDYAAKMLGKQDRTKLNIRVIPEPLTQIQQLMHMLGQQVSIGQYPGQDSVLMKTVVPFMHKAQVIERNGPVQVYDPGLPIIHP